MAKLCPKVKVTDLEILGTENLTLGLIGNNFRILSWSTSILHTVDVLLPTSLSILNNFHVEILPQGQGHRLIKILSIENLTLGLF